MAAKDYPLASAVPAADSTSTPIHVWAFDLGKASIGEAVRKGNRFLHKASLLIPAEFADTGPATTRRRAYRTRLAHKAREQWLDTLMRAADIEPLQGRRCERNPETKKWELKHQGDARLEQEFAKPGDSTCYTSCLLRIKLLRGEKLEPWQIYKALHSAIQKRGYGRVPWAAREEKRSGKTEEEMEKELLKKDPIYREAVEAWPKFKQQNPDTHFHFPCYYDAAKMGLWEAKHPDALRDRIDYHAASTRRVRFDRDDVNSEIATLGRQAAAQLAPLRKAFESIQEQGWKQRDEHTGQIETFRVAAKDFGEFLVHGPAGAPDKDALNDFAGYLKFRHQHKLHPGSEHDWMGATGQKTPRFDNRIINDCALPEGHQVCNVAIRYDKKNQRAFLESLLATEVTFLMKLKNTWVEDTPTQRKLTVEELRGIFKAVTAEALAKPTDAKDWSGNVAKTYALAGNAWGRKKGIKELELRPLPGHEIIKPPKTEGRSRFSRPALRLSRALILSGNKPSEFKRRLLSREPGLLAELGLDLLDAEPIRAVNGAKQYIKQPRPWILPKHLKFLDDLARANDTWEGIHLPEQRLDALEARYTDESGKLNVAAAIRELIGSINDPVVRHRLEVFAKRLRTLHRGDDEGSSGFGVPDMIVLEFIREDFMGEQAKRDLAKFQSDREKARAEAKEKTATLGTQERSATLKYELCKAQSCECLYCGQAFAMTDLEDYDIEHVVPRKQGGPDAMVNYVLAHKKCNDTKGDLTPFQWLHGKEGWDAYVKRVERHGTALRNKKVQLLLREDAPELVERYTALAETAWISRLAQKIVSLHFGWRNGNDAEGRKRVTVVSGGLTGRIRRKYHLNSVLNPPPPGTEDLVAWESNADKNRDDDRHHALDAMVISFLPQWARDQKKEKFFRFPEEVHRNAKAYFAKEIAGVTPRPLVRLRPALEETLYGQRQLNGDRYVVKRRPLVDLAIKEVRGKLQLKPFKDISPQKIVDGAIRKIVETFLEANPNLTLEHWLAWSETAQRGSAGPRIQQVLMTESKANEVEEYANFSKAGESGRGQYRRGASHAGYFIIKRAAPTKKDAQAYRLEVRPVFAFQSRAKVEKALREEIGVEVVDYFFSNCQANIEREWEFKGEKFPAGEYTLKTLWTQGNAVLKHAQRGMIGAKPKHNAPIPLRTLVQAAIRRTK